MVKQKQQSFLTNWTEVGGPDSAIVRENTTGREGERRIVALDPIFSAKDQQFIYNYRKDTKVPFVNAYGSEILTLQKPTAAEKKDKNRAKELKDPYSHIAVITERIPHRLVDSPQLTYPETLYVLDRALEGYEVAYQKCGPMRVNDRMIGFNNQGQTKVWVNEDFANNHPSYPRRRLLSTRVDTKQFLEGRYSTRLPVSADESDMVQDVVDTVEDYCEEGRFPEPFASRIHQRNLSFGDARRLIHETIAENRIPVPDRVDLFTNKVRGWRRTTNTTHTHTNQGNINTHIHTVQPPTQVVTTTTHTQRPAQGYKFNYLPAERPYQPEIFASRVGEHGVYNGVRY